MASKRLKRVLKATKEYLTPLESQSSSSVDYFLGPTLEPYSTQRLNETSPRIASRHYQELPTPDNDEADKINRDRLEQAKLSQSHDALVQSKKALDLTLRSQHRLLIATLITALIAILVAIISSSVALIVAFHTKPPVVYVRPDVTINR